MGPSLVWGLEQENELLTTCQTAQLLETTLTLMVADLLGSAGLACLTRVTITVACFLTQSMSNTNWKADRRWIALCLICLWSQQKEEVTRMNRTDLQLNGSRFRHSASQKHECAKHVCLANEHWLVSDKATCGILTDNSNHCA